MHLLWHKPWTDKCRQQNRRVLQFLGSGGNGDSGDAGGLLLSSCIDFFLGHLVNTSWQIHLVVPHWCKLGFVCAKLTRAPSIQARQGFRAAGVAWSGHSLP
jgi:hypothetical protein